MTEHSEFLSHLQTYGFVDSVLAVAHGKRTLDEVVQNGMGSVRSGKMILRGVSKDEIREIISGFADRRSVSSNDTLYSRSGSIPFLFTCRCSTLRDMIQLDVTIVSAASNFDAAYASLVGLFDRYVVLEDDLVFADVTWGYMVKNVFYMRVVREILDDELVDEAYPNMPEGVDATVDEYLESDESVLLLTGEKGTGKTRFLRHVVRRFAETFGKTPQVLYTSDPSVLKDENFYIQIRAGGYDFVVLEDLDGYLSERDGSNEVMHRILGASDGFLRADWTKIMITTNLAVGRLDPALSRPGRCFGHYDFGELSSENVSKLLNVLDPGARDRADERHPSATVAEVYSMVKNRRKISAKTVAGFCVG